MQEPISAIIIDDEASARASIRFIIEHYFDNIHIVDEAESVATALVSIEKHKPQLLFLDITLPDGNGFDILSQYPHPFFKVIFITGNDDFAIKAFRYNALNYIMKPIDPDEITKAVSHSLQRFYPQNTASQVAHLLAQMQSPEQSRPKQLFIETKQDTFVVKINNIIRCEKHIDKTVFFLLNQQKITVEKSFSYYKDLLLDLSFCLVHPEHLINLQHVVKYNRNENFILMSDDSTVPILSNKKEAFLKKTAAL